MRYISMCPWKYIVLTCIIHIMKVYRSMPLRILLILLDNNTKELLSSFSKNLRQWILPSQSCTYLTLLISLGLLGLYVGLCVGLYDERLDTYTVVSGSYAGVIERSLVAVGDKGVTARSLGPVGDKRVIELSVTSLFRVTGITTSSSTGVIALDLVLRIIASSYPEFKTRYQMLPG